MADEQENRPSDNARDFRKVVDIGSASSWNIFELNVFKVHSDEAPLPSVVSSYVDEVSLGSHDPDAIPPEIATEEWTKYSICQSGTGLC